MKRIEAIIQADKLATVIDSLKAVGIGGATITQSRGVGSGQRPVIQGSRGTARHAAHTGNRGDGKIFVTNVEEAFDIATRQSGRNII